jgi:hypothetical protein
VLRMHGTNDKDTEAAVRAGEDRFRTLLEFWFDVYWETDAQQRFTRQEASEELADAPARGSELGKTRWEVTYLEPDEEAGREHRATLNAHIPFRDLSWGGRHPTAASAKCGGPRNVGGHGPARGPLPPPGRAHHAARSIVGGLDRCCRMPSP